jgi:hypothetical protein
MWAFAIALGGGVAIIAAGCIALSGHSAAADAFIQRRELEALGHVVWSVVIAIGAGFVVSALVFRPRRGVQALLGGLASLWLVWSIWSYPLLNDSSSAAGVMRRARELAGPEVELDLVAWKEQNLLMAIGPVRDFGFNRPWNEQYAEAVAWQSASPSTRRLFILEDAMGACIDRTRGTRVGHANRRDWWLVPAEAIVPGCVPAIGTDAEAGDAGDP